MGKPHTILMAIAGTLLVACAEREGTGPVVEPPPANAATVRLQQVVTGLSNPVHLTSPAADARQFVVEQPGRIRIIANGQLVPTPFLDITPKVMSGGERGLLSVAFHPDYRTNGLFFVYYTRLPQGD